MGAPVIERHQGEPKPRCGKSSSGEDFRKPQRITKLVHGGNFEECEHDGDSARLIVDVGTTRQIPRLEKALGVVRPGRPV